MPRRAAIARDVPVGAGGSRLLRGNHREHEALETEAAAFFGAESALFFSGGFMANVAIFSTLPQARRSRRARRADPRQRPRRRARRQSRARRGRAQRRAGLRGCDQGLAPGGRHRNAVDRVESLYSMDGDRAPLADLIAIADRHEGMLVIDEAHATGVLGPDGRGLGAELEGRANVVTLHTCGKALGVMGALVLGPDMLRDYLVNRCRPFIFATAPSPLIGRAGARGAHHLPLRSGPAREAAAARRRRRARACKPVRDQRRRARRSSRSSSAAMTRATRLAGAMQARGFDIRAVRPPTVPEGTARLRLSLTLERRCGTA